MPERKSFSDLRMSEVLDDILFEKKNENFVLCYSTSIRPVLCIEMFLI